MTHEEALDILRDLHEKSIFSERKALETIIPELKYSKDELIRQSLLIYFLKTTTEWFAGAKREDIVVWLKKLGNHKFDIGDTISNGDIKYRVVDIVKNSVNKDCYSLARAGKIVDPFLWDCEQADILFEKL